MKLPGDLTWWSMCEHLVRPAVVAAGRARLAADDWPAAIEVADAVLAGTPPRPIVVC